MKKTVVYALHLHSVKYEKFVFSAHELSTPTASHFRQTGYKVRTIDRICCSLWQTLTGTRIG